jgi:uncharacterized membrane protein YeaQ/YmgE (transglycosylase-associated protein family)
VLGTIVGLIIIGLIAGAIARLLITGRQPLTIPQTILLGIIGSFVGGFIGHFLFNTHGGFVQTSGWIGSIIGSVIVLLAYLRFERSRA